MQVVERKTFFRNDSGGVLAFFALSLPLVLMMMAVVYDLGFARMTSNRLQISADAAALAGASVLPDHDDVKAEAVLYAHKNFNNAGLILTAADTTIGNWDGTTFTPGGMPENAVETVARRAQINGNPLQNLFRLINGVNEFDLSRRAVALGEPSIACSGGGFYSDEKVTSGSNNDYGGDFCLYGADGVKIGSDNSFGDGNQIVMDDLSDFEQGGNNSGVNNSLIEDTKTLVLPALVPGIINDMNNADFSGLPSFMTGSPVVSLPEITDSTPINANTIYIVTDVADFGSGANLTNIVVVAGKEIKTGGNSTLENVVFATPDKILLGSDNVIGGSDYCNSGEYNVYLLSESNIEFGSNTTLRGVQMGAQGEIKLGSDITAILGVHGEAEGSIEYGSSQNFAACPSGLTSSFGELVSNSGVTLSLVQ
jgi:putative Flp pilus-assembly TadE/G-like protein